MNIELINTEADYDLALKEIESLFGTPIGSEDSVCLEHLVTLVEKYEEEHYPTSPPDPIADAEYEREKSGLRDAELASLSEKSEDDIDFSDIPATTEADWDGAVRGKFYEETQKERDQEAALAALVAQGQELKMGY